MRWVTAAQRTATRLHVGVPPLQEHHRLALRQHGARHQGAVHPRALRLLGGLRRRAGNGAQLAPPVGTKNVFGTLRERQPAVFGRWLSRRRDGLLLSRVRGGALLVRRRWDPGSLATAVAVAVPARLAVPVAVAVGVSRASTAPVAVAV